MKFSEYPSTSTFTDDQIMLVDGSTGTKKVQAKTAVLAGLELNNVINHRNIFRGKNLGSALTSAQKSAIQNGTFDDLWLGDYWVIDGVNYRIADFDYWYNVGDTKFLKHHLVIVPDTTLTDAQMNSTAVANTGYAGSAMRSSTIEGTIKTKIKSAFGDANVLTRREYLVNSVNNDLPATGSWYDSTVELMNEIMVYGCAIKGSTQSTASAHTWTACKTQLALFRVAPTFANIGKIYWLRDTSSQSEFCRVYSSGLAQSYSANTSVGVRPVFAIG